MGMCLVIAINFAYYLATRPGRKGGNLLKLAYWGFILAAAVAVFWTGSRSSVLDLAIWLVLTVTTVFRVGWKPAAVLVLCLAAAVYIIPRVVPEGLLSQCRRGRRRGRSRASRTLGTVVPGMGQESHPGHRFGSHLHLRGHGKRQP